MDDRDRIMQLSELTRALKVRIIKTPQVTEDICRRAEQIALPLQKIAEKLQWRRNERELVELESQIIIIRKELSDLFRDQLNPLMNIKKEH